MAKKIRVGLIGISANRGWAAMVHMPALRDLPQYEIKAVATTRQSSADEAAKHFGVPLAFGDPQALIDHPEIDLVVITVKAPHHHALTMNALKAGKHVYCEWPLGVTSEQAQEMRDLAQAKGVCHMIGLQGRGSPTIQYVRDLIAQNYIGDVLSCTMLTTVPNWALGLDSANAYILDAQNGATVLSIAGGHSLDILSYCLGEWASLNATLATQRKTATLVDTGETVSCTSPDNIAITGTLQSGAIASVHIQGGVPHATKFLFEINGRGGSLSLRDTGPLSAQMAPLKLEGSNTLNEPLQPLPIPEKYRLVPENYGESVYFNVAQLYVRLADAILSNDPSRAQPDFNQALTRHHLLDAIVTAAQSGERQTPL